MGARRSFGLLRRTLTLFVAPDVPSLLPPAVSHAFMSSSSTPTPTPPAVLSPVPAVSPLVVPPFSDARSVKKVYDYLMQRNIRIDWRQGGVAAVKNQGDTRSCCYFAVSTLLEYLIYHKWGKIVTVSAQDLWNASDLLSGNDPMEDILKGVLHQGFVLEEHCPWVGKKQIWERPEGIRSYRLIEKAIQLYPLNECEALCTLTKGPFIGNICPGPNFDDYESGFYTGEFKLGNIGHCVVVVALEMSKDGELNWVIQNSYGLGHGIRGFINIPVGCGALFYPNKDNIGILNPIVTAKMVKDW